MINGIITGLQCDWLVLVLHGVGVQMLISLKTWRMLEVYLRGVGMLKFSLPLSYPLSSDTKFSFKGGIKCIHKVTE